MLGLISSSSVVLAIVGGIPVTVVLLAAIWVRPVKASFRRMFSAWLSLTIVRGALHRE